MKVTPELYQELLEGMRFSAVQMGGAEGVEVYRNMVSLEPRFQPGGEGDLEKRVRWDLVWNWNSYVVRKYQEMYGFDQYPETWFTRTAAIGCNQDHRDAAVRKAMKELGL